MNKTGKCHKWRNTFLQAEGNVTDLCDKSKSSDIYSSIYFWIACLSSEKYLANVCCDAFYFMFIWLMTHVWSKSRTRSKFRKSRLLRENIWTQPIWIFVRNFTLIKFSYFSCMVHVTIVIMWLIMWLIIWSYSQILEKLRPHFPLL